MPDINTYFGKINIEVVHNIGKIDANNVLTEDDIQFVHYADSQQICIWLPDIYTNYKNIVIQQTNSQKLIFESEVSTLVNGNIKIILDSLFIPVGHFVIKINSIYGFSYEIFFRKWGDHEKITSTSVPTLEDKTTDKSPVKYRDGFGNIIRDDDETWRDFIWRTCAKILRNVTFETYGREGAVIYHEGFKTIKFYMEMGGTDVIFYLNIPTIEDWEQATGFALQEREDILKYVAENTQRHQAPSCDYEIKESEILFRKK